MTVIFKLFSGHFFAKNEQYSEISGFVDAYEKIYKQLCPYFAAFFKHYKPPPMLEKNPQKHKMLRLMDLEMQKRHEEWRGRCATPQFEYNLPKLPVKLKQNVKGVQVSFSFQEGIRAKVRSRKNLLRFILKTANFELVRIAFS